MIDGGRVRRRRLLGLLVHLLSKRLARYRCLKKGLPRGRWLRADACGGVGCERWHLYTALSKVWFLEDCRG